MEERNAGSLSVLVTFDEPCLGAERGETEPVFFSYTQSELPTLNWTVGGERRESCLGCHKLSVLTECL